MDKKINTAISSHIVKVYGKEAGADIVGSAAAKGCDCGARGFKRDEKLEGCLSVIVLGTPFPRESLEVSKSAYTDIRNAMVTKMTDAAKKVTKRIKALGYQAKSISSLGGEYIDGKFYGHISLKHAAELAGLGIIGRNYLLTSPQYGNLLWFSAVLTDAELTPDKREPYNICANCNKCVEACPSGALNDPASFAGKDCGKTCWKTVNNRRELDCYLCRLVCPYRLGDLS